jgi:mRNA deadenylase 3'-5' endonuclease subunit Ccr4
VVSYNILADLYASSTAGKTELFAYCPAYARNIHYRKLLLLKELIGTYSISRTDEEGGNIAIIGNLPSPCYI